MCRAIVYVEVVGGQPDAARWQRRPGRYPVDVTTAASIQISGCTPTLAIIVRDRQVDRIVTRTAVDVVACWPRIRTDEYRIVSTQGVDASLFLDHDVVAFIATLEQCVVAQITSVENPQVDSPAVVGLAIVASHRDRVGKTIAVDVTTQFDQARYQHLAVGGGVGQVLLGHPPIL